MIPGIRSMGGYMGGLQLTLRGYGFAKSATDLADMTLNYGTLSGGSAPIAGDLVVWTIRSSEAQSSYLNSPIQDLTSSGWTQQRSFFSSLSGTLGATVLAKVVTASDISSPGLIVDNPRYGAGGMWIAYRIASGSVTALSIAGYVAKFAGSSTVSSTVVTSTAIPDDHYAITVAFGGGTNATIDLSASGMVSDIQFQFQLSTNFICEFIANTFLGGLTTTISMPDEGSLNSTLGAYVQVR